MSPVRSHEIVKAFPLSKLGPEIYVVLEGEQLVELGGVCMMRALDLAVEESAHVSVRFLGRENPSQLLIRQPIGGGSLPNLGQDRLAEIEPRSARRG